jgi:hypothetical protein
VHYRRSTVEQRRVGWRRENVTKRVEKMRIWGTDNDATRRFIGREREEERGITKRKREGGMERWMYTCP